MADTEQLQRTNARLHQELRTRDDRCRQLQREKEELSARLESQNLTVESLREDVHRLQDILQKVRCRVNWLVCEVMSPVRVHTCTL